MYIVFDVGGTKTRLAVSVDGETLQGFLTLPTERDFRTAMQQLVVAARSLTGGRQVLAVAGGSRALDKASGTLRAHPTFPLWVGEPLRDTLAKHFRAPVYLENDAAVAAVGEALVGAGQGHDIVAYMTISTGVGGAQVVRGTITETAFGFEPGNQIIMVKNGDPQRWEDLVSGEAIRQRYGVAPEALTDGRAWEEICWHLALGINNVIVHWSPDVVVIGGGVAEHPGLDMVRVTAHLQRILLVYPTLPPLQRGTLGDAAALHGALALARRQIGAVSS